MIGALGKVLAVGSSGELVTRLKMEDGQADGNLIARGGIQLGKGELAVERPAACRDVDYRNRTRICKLSYNSGGSRFRI